MSFNKFYEELEKTGLMDRAMALGKEADLKLQELEGTIKHNTKERKIKRICLYCGEKSDQPNFIFVHKCENPIIVEEKILKCPSRPIAVRFFEIIYYKKTYRFIDYFSAMHFRRLLWLENIPLKEALTNKDLRWYK